MGFTGEIHQKKGLKFDNSHGVLITKENDDEKDEDFEN